MKKWMKNARLVMADRILEDGALYIDGGKIGWVGPARQAPQLDAEETVDCGGLYLSPGLIDVHCHGGDGGSFMSTSLEEHVRAMRYHLRNGVTSMTPTPTGPSAEDMEKLAGIKREIDARADLPHHLGYFMEGPFTMPHPDLHSDVMDGVQGITPEKYIPVIEAAQGAISRWMAAVELPGALEFGRCLRQNGIIGCIGHSAATYPQVVSAMESGYSCVTHLYSVMSTVTRSGGFRTGGLVESGLLLDDLDVELICDGCHLPPELIRLAVKCKGYDRLMLVSDATPLAGAPEGEHDFMGFRVIIEDGVSKAPDRSCFLGSIASGVRLVRTVYKLAGFPLWAAVRMMTKTPARHLGYAGVKGELAVGADADLILFDEDMNIQRVYLLGQQPEQ